MATIHKLTKDGATIFPATITDAVVHQDTGKTLTSMIKEYNVSELFPTEGIAGGNTYNLALAVQVLGTHLRASEKTGGIKLTFISSVFGGPMEEYYLGKNMWSSNSADWKQRIEVGDAIIDPAGDWDPSSAEAYIDQQIATEASTRLAQDTYLGNEINIIKKNKIYLTGSTLSRSQINQTNTIYVIKDDLTLTENINVPANCVLEFDGGSVSAGSGQNMDTITGVNTSINAELVKIFNTNITLAGTWNVAEAYPEWFGIIANDNNADLSLAMSQLNSFNAKVHFGKGIYNTLNPVKLIDVEGVSPKDTIISMKKSGTGLYTAYVGDITVPSSSLVRENWFLRNLAIVIDAPTAQDNITSSCALLIGNSGYSNIENCLITTYYYNIKATETFTEQQRIEAAKNDDKTLENSANSGVRFKGYVDGLVVKATTFGGQIGIYQEEDSILDSDTFINCYTIGSPRGYASIIFNGSVSSITFQQLSINQAMFGIKAYNNFNGIIINGGRNEQSIVLKDPDDNKVLGGFLYVNKTDNDIIAATILSYYMDSYVNGIYLKNGSGRINVGIYNLYNRGNYGTDLKYALYASSSNSASVINTRNATFQNAPVILDGMIISECDYADIDSSGYILISNCIIRNSQYEVDNEYKSYRADAKKIFAPFVTRGTVLPIRLTKRLKDVSGFTCCRLKGIANMYNAASVSGYVKSIDFDILVDKNGNIIKEEKVNDTGNDMSTSVDTSTCIVTLTFTGLTDIIGECIFYKSTYAYI